MLKKPVAERMNGEGSIFNPRFTGGNTFNLRHHASHGHPLRISNHLVMRILHGHPLVELSPRTLYRVILRSRPGVVVNQISWRDLTQWYCSRQQALLLDVIADPIGSKSQFLDQFPRHGTSQVHTRLPLRQGLPGIHRDCHHVPNAGIISAVSL